MLKINTRVKTQLVGTGTVIGFKHFTNDGYPVRTNEATNEKEEKVIVELDGDYTIKEYTASPEELDILD